MEPKDASSQADSTLVDPEALTLTENGSFSVLCGVCHRGHNFSYESWIHCVRFRSLLLQKLGSFNYSTNTICGASMLQHAELKEPRYTGTLNVKRSW